MKSRFALLLLAGLMPATSALAQEYRHAVGISVGTFNLQSLDKQASPLRYSGSIRPHFGLAYRHMGENSRFSLRLSGGTGSMNPERFGARTFSTTFPDGKPFSYQVSSELYNATLEADYLQRVSSPDNAHSAVWVGGAFQESAWYASEVANFPWLVNSATFSPVVQLDHTFTSRHSFTIRVDMALIGLITRAIYANFPKSTSDNNVSAFFRQGTRTELAGKLKNVNLQVGYSYRLSPRMNVGAGYRVRYFSYPSPEKIRAVSSTLYLDSEFRF
ncbi:hypothetical protein [Spirosoma linguale]|uniref:Outer membrane protein beta-barrel domain-containing protein n=1 Tax=Spirosoma linguale (strain ATCC 33905 / DSM 74 / LMG 10896 / Claus 1) TaxID=504472 RepID=D2QDJ7_SPILD|nr:hypothetical protein Slin_2088 [Spirosoma linguale DSM 74]